ncbi:ferritin-like domain-containing protein [uncultured Roseobacter sp.]|uniref:ferritin-like domain-containing protein n=1 Tax=uncultured Roseobacter sp. TaxID=114847 RepID=UPI00262CEC3F|nr:ferritin-like domain-containing protein [uncultured Roseobacter sp.]
MINPGTKFELADLVSDEMPFTTLIGRYGAANAPNDTQLSAHIYRLAKDAEDKQGKHDQDELYLVLEGEREIEIHLPNGQDPIHKSLKPLDLVYVPKHHAHSFLGSDRFVTLVIFTPEFTGPTITTESAIHTRDDLIEALRLACRLEHGLMVQYLFASFSLASEPDGLDPETWEAVRVIREQILKVAREEMAHLGTVANLMIAIGATPDFSLPPFPQKNIGEWFPFPFCLERIGNESMERFLRFEQPEEDDSDGEIDHIGELYRSIYSGFLNVAGTTETLFDGDFFDQDSNDWGAGLEIFSVRSTDDVESAIRFIIEEGEGSSIQPDLSDLKLPPHEFFNGRRSHYERFLYIQQLVARLETEKVPWRKNVLNNPAAKEDPARHGDVTLIESENAVRAAELFNDFYVSLLLMLMAFYDHAQETDEERALLRRLMKGTMSGIIRPLAEIITDLPAFDKGDVRAAPTFEIGAYVSVAPKSPARWKRLFERVSSSLEKCRKLQSDGVHGRFEFVLRNIEIIHEEIDQVRPGGSRNA